MEESESVSESESCASLSSASVMSVKPKAPKKMEFKKEIFAPIKEAKWEETPNRNKEQSESSESESSQGLIIGDYSRQDVLS